jgi:hypothetical protein
MTLPATANTGTRPPRSILHIAELDCLSTKETHFMTAVPHHLVNVMAGALCAAAALVVSLDTKAWAEPSGNVKITGERRVWHAMTFSIEGRDSGEQDANNPFLNSRLEGVFSKGERRHTVTGYYAADGNAGQSGADRGNIWRIHFVADEPGQWQYQMRLYEGNRIALSDDPARDGKLVKKSEGLITVMPTDKWSPPVPGTNRDFRGLGFLRHTRGHHLRFVGRDEPFIKAGADSPENFLGYADFDGTYRIGKLKRRPGENFAEGLHQYKPHVRDWKPGDPIWRGGKGKGIIGALNYLASKGMNSVYFLTMNVGGDGKDVWPWTSHDERFRFDCSKLDQWEIVFSHMDQLGVMLHVVLQEQENDQLLDGGHLGPERRLYLRELIARFGHHLGLQWNLGEENTNTDAQRKAFCQYIKQLDPYDHPIVCHTFPGKYDQVYRPLLGFRYFNGPSLQTNDTHNQTVKWVTESTKAGRPWFVCLDEIGPANTGVKPDKDDPSHDEVRQKHLWGNLMGGGAGAEWYFGYKYAHNDLNCEDWRSRENMWNQTRHALSFFHRYLPFTEMRPADGLLSQPDAYCLAKFGHVVAVYLPRGGTTTIDLSWDRGIYAVQWYNPRKGGDLITAPTGRIELADTPKPTIGPPPSDPDQDWVVLLRNTSPPDRAISPPKSMDVTRIRAGGSNRDKPVSGTPGTVTGFTLINADTNRSIKGFEPLNSGATLDLAKLPTRNLSIRADVTGRAGRVQFDLDGKSNYRSEGTAPYALEGDTNGNYNAWTPRPGRHRLTATPLVGSRAGGAATITFTVIDSK